MKFGVVIFPGSNGDPDMIGALEDMGQQVITIWHKDTDLGGLGKGDCVILPGGFSFGDYLRCGSIARFSPVMDRLIDFARSGGKVLGVCNGFQVLCESGLLPGVLLQNANTKFICRNVFIKSEKSGSVYQIPIAHGEGRYYIDPDGLADLEKNGQVIYRYCNAAGDTEHVHAPNGSLNGIAAVSNKEGNVIGMMPHPERACNPLLGNTDGIKVFEELFQMQLQGQHA